MKVMITGAAGRVGQAVAEALSDDHELVLVDRRGLEGSPVVRADLARGRSLRLPGTWLTGRRSWQRHLPGTRVLIHLASEARPGAKWRSHLRDGWIAGRNALFAAVAAGVPRVVLASSHRVVRASLEGAAPDLFDARERLPGSHTSPRPLTEYGVAKAALELTGRMLVDQGRLASFIAIRIGSFNDERPEKLPDRNRWLSRPELHRIFRRVVEAELDGFHVLYGVNLDDSTDIDLSHTWHVMGRDIGPSWPDHDRPLLDHDPYPTGKRKEAL